MLLFQFCSSLVVGAKTSLWVWQDGISRGFGHLLPHLQLPEGLGWCPLCPFGDGMRSRALAVQSWLPAWFLPSAKHHVADPGERRQSLLLLKYFWKYFINTVEPQVVADLGSGFGPNKEN